MLVGAVQFRVIWATPAVAVRAVGGPADHGDGGGGFVGGDRGSEGADGFDGVVVGDAGGGGPASMNVVVVAVTLPSGVGDSPPGVVARKIW